MFDIGFAELLLVAIVGLVVLGPERLPGAIRTVTLWVGRFRRSFNAIKKEIEKEVGADEIRRQLHNESILKDLEEGKNQLKEIEENLSNNIKTLDENIQQTAKEQEKS
jgi:sec-independent protein translocase protein TatB